VALVQCAVRWTWRAFLAVFLCAFTQPVAAIAQEAQPKYGWQEVWAGADVTKDVWLLYSGVTLAPMSEHIYSPGLRLRAAGGYGRYTYTATSQQCVPILGCTSTNRPITVDFNYAEALVGWHDQFGELTVKGFVGIASISHLLNAVDPQNATNGTEIGVKGVVEVWLNLGDSAWTSLDLAYTTAHETGSARWRAGWRPFKNVSIGPELRYDESGVHKNARAGAFLRYEWLGGEISAASGFAETLTVDDRDRAIYGTVNLLLQF
jgi:hypothetical protein